MRSWTKLPTFTPSICGPSYRPSSVHLSRRWHGATSASGNIFARRDIQTMHKREHWDIHSMVMNLSQFTIGDAGEQSWAPVHERTAQLIQSAIRRYLDNPQDFYQPVEAATLKAARILLEQHPHLADDIRAHLRLNIHHWVSANTRLPGQRVSPIVGPRNANFARDLASYGWDTAVQEIIESGKRASLSVWNNVAFELTADPNELRDYLNAVTRSIFTYCDDYTTALNAVAGPERQRISNLADVRRIKAVKNLLGGTPASSTASLDVLNYEIDAPHTAAIAWAESQPESAFDDVLTALARAAGAARTLAIPAGTSARWLWLSAENDIDVERLRNELKNIPDIRMAIGTQGHGVSGFRSSHLDALAAQRMMCRLSRHIQVASYRELDMFSLVADNETRAREFVSRSLGDLATANRELRDTLWTYLREGSNITRTAELLYAHRNTIVNRLDKIRMLLPAPLEGNIIKVGLALEISQALGEPAGIIN
ncbi:PucR family transcriptional regulator [Mycobacteroides abscessus]|uniref:PucR family transcriptional regulator n=1 Tax=Mycobacteroides abscessus TaxID=36809 RepID=UPI00104ADDF4|nr:helix-turn-helix domain-containing protein [Mycobacteroides abscessus]